MNKKILRLAIPSIVSNITVPLLGMVDVAITGHMGDARYMAAIAVGSMAFNIIYWMFSFLRFGTGGMTAQEYGKAQKADKIVKETHEVEVKDDNGNKTSVIENDYYAINLERKHRIKAGAMNVDGDTYIKAAYQNRDVEYEVYHSLKTGKTGVGVEATIAKW